MNYKVIYLILFVSIVTTSCENLLFEENKQSTDARKNFEYLWKECKEKYSFLEYKNVNWDAIYAKYDVRIKDGMDEEQLFTELGNMLNELRDGHNNLFSSFNVSRFDVSLLGPKNFDDRLLKEFYLSKNYFITGPFVHDFLDSGRVGYIRFGEFTGTINDEQLNFILTRFQQTNGIILDIRQNGGGVANDIFALLSRFIDVETHLYTTYIKSGPGINEFSAGEKCMLKPHDGVKYLKKVMVLTDRGTYSAGSFTSLATKAIPNLILVGDTTGGGLGMPNGGQLPNGWTYRFSITKSLGLSGENYEDGVPPDIYVTLNPTNMINGKDDVIDRAIAEIN